MPQQPLFGKLLWRHHLAFNELGNKLFFMSFTSESKYQPKRRLIGCTFSYWKGQSSGLFVSFYGLDLELVDLQVWHLVTLLMFQLSANNMDALNSYLRYDWLKIEEAKGKGDTFKRVKPWTWLNSGLKDTRTLFDCCLLPKDNWTSTF